jgi:hypothetical protein
VRIAAERSAMADLAQEPRRPAWSARSLGARSDGSRRIRRAGAGSSRALTPEITDDETRGMGEIPPLAFTYLRGILAGCVLALTSRSGKASPVTRDMWALVVDGNTLVPRAGLQLARHALQDAMIPIMRAALPGHRGSAPE